MDVMRERCDRCGAREGSGISRYVDVGGQGLIMHCQPVACSDIAKISELFY
jgi:hypothetical protein